MADLSNDLSHILNELGEDRESYFNAVSPPIIQTSNFIFKKVEDLRQGLEDEMSGYLYSRGLNPTVEILRKKLAAMDGAEDCLVFNSGSSAIFASVFSNVKAGDHITAKVYEGDFSTLYEVRNVIEKRMFSQVEDLLPVISFGKKQDSETEKKHEEFVQRMVERGYTPRQVRRLVEWYMRVKKSS
jgi:cystathionine beta-lyase/cystathionine gamma-synthase